MSGRGRKWLSVTAELAEQIRTHLLREGGRETEDIKGTSEAWRIRLSDATFTYYHSGTLYSTDSVDPAVHRAWQVIRSLVGSRFIPTEKAFLIGLDEAGKGETLGHTVLAGVLIPAHLFDDLEAIVSVGNTKQRRPMAYWDDLFRNIDSFKRCGLQYIVEKIPPWHVDRYNLNRIMDVVYQRILSMFSRHVNYADCRVVVDDYGVGHSLERYLRALENGGAEVISVSNAEHRFLEACVASLVAKRERERVIDAIQRDPEFSVEGITIGSGNAGDKRTILWLRAWKSTGREWPWFVKRSFKPVRKLDGLSGRPHKQNPPVREDILDPGFLDEFHHGKFSITSLSVVCPSCGYVSKGALLTPDQAGNFSARCIACKKPIEDTGPTLRYFCGYVLPDSNIIRSGLISKDLKNSRFFEGFTVLMSAIVRQECDTSGGKKELGELSRFAAMGRITMENVGSITPGLSSVERDEIIRRTALEYNAVLLTDDQNLRAAAIADRMFVISTRWEAGSG